MADQKVEKDVKSYADGWMTERKGTDVPAFLKFAYIVIAGGCLAYFLVFMNGEINHSTRGALVRQFNAVTQSSSGFMYFVAALIAIFAIITVKFAFGKFHED
jgi:SNF family Na+-dependent transporter